MTARCFAFCFSPRPSSLWLDKLRTFLIQIKTAQCPAAAHRWTVTGVGLITLNMGDQTIDTEAQPALDTEGLRRPETGSASRPCIES
jgi:hypothetical protein